MNTCVPPLISTPLFIKLSNLFALPLFTVGQQLSDYGWDVVSASVPSNYICEISKTDAKARLLVVRDFSKCLIIVQYLTLCSNTWIWVELSWYLSWIKLNLSWCLNYVIMLALGMRTHIDSLADWFTYLLLKV